MAPQSAPHRSAALWIGLMATVVAAVVLGLVLPFPSDTATNLVTYPTLLKALGPPLGAVVLGVVLLHQALEADRKALEGRILAHANATMNLGQAEWERGTEERINQGLSQGLDPAGGAGLVGALEHRRHIVHQTRALLSLVGPLVAGTGSVVALAAWAVPASGQFLTGSFPQVDHVLVAYEVLGSAFALGAMVYLMTRLLRWEESLGPA